MDDRKEKIEEFLKTLGESTKGEFYLICGACGATDTVSEGGGQYIENEMHGVYSDYTGHLWDTINIKCKECGNAHSFDK